MYFITQDLRLITRAAFFMRFTDAELEDMEYLSIDDTAATTQVRRNKARLRIVLSILRSAEFINLANDRIRTWVQLMETRGLIGAGRATQILDTVPTGEELYTR